MNPLFHNYSVILSMHLPLNFPCDYFERTAEVLNKRNQVIFLDFRIPYSYGDLLNISKLKRLIISIRNIIKNKNGNVDYRPFPLLPFQRFMFVYKINVLFGFFQLRLIHLLINRKIIYWGFHPIMEEGLGKLGELVSVFDYLDLYGEDNMAEYKIQEEKLFKKVDLIAFNSKALYKYKTVKYPTIRPKSFITVCGFDDRFVLQVARNKSNKRNVIFAGQVNYRINYPLLFYLVKNNPGINFHIYGRIDQKYVETVNNLVKMSNVYYHKEVEKSHIAGIYRKSDIGIIPYDTSYATVKYSNPMKTYEYIAMGLPVVSTVIEPLLEVKSKYFYCTENFRLFNQKLREFISIKFDKRLHIQYRSIALSQSWERKIGSIANSIMLEIELKKS